MLFTLAGKEYFIIFRYYKQPAISHTALKMGAMFERVTEVSYGEMRDGKKVNIAVAKTICSPIDNFNKAVGRKIVLLRLISKLRWFDREHEIVNINAPEWVKVKHHRNEFWLKYHVHTKAKWLKAEA